MPATPQVIGLFFNMNILQMRFHTVKRPMGHQQLTKFFSLVSTFYFAYSRCVVYNTYPWIL